MSEKRRKKYKHEHNATEPTKEELKMAKFVRFKSPKKTTVCQKQNLEYFVGSKAVDTLMNSKWAKASKKSNAVLQSRADAVIFMDKLLRYNMLYRAKRVLRESKSKADLKSKGAKSEAEDTKPSKVRKRKKGKEESINEEEQNTEEKKTDEKKKKKKYKLDVHEEQIFLDSSDLYVWVYDPLSTKKMILGGFLILGIIGATLFPLWPPEVRIGVYYLSVAGGVFVGSILAIAVCRSILFGIIWAVTLGKHHLWFLPNLLADVGFFDSFKPLYTYEVKGEKSKSGEKEKNSDSDGEENAVSAPQDDAIQPDDVILPSPPPDDAIEPEDVILPSPPQDDVIEPEDVTEDFEPHKEGKQLSQEEEGNCPEEVANDHSEKSSQDEMESTSDYEIIEETKS